jgi:hypothetical protein
MDGTHTGLDMGNATIPSTGSKIRVREITETDLPRLTDLLTEGFPQRGRCFWGHVLACLSRHQPPAELPKYGYLLERDLAPVGVILLICSKVPQGTDLAIRCNVSSWYVRHSYRGYASFLASKALGHKGATYLNITAAPHTRPIAMAQGYRQYSAGFFLAVPWLNFCGPKSRVEVFDPQRHVDVDPFERDLLLSHMEYGCISLWVSTAKGGQPFVFRPRVLKSFLVCAQLVYCREINQFVGCAGPVGRYLAARGRPLVMLDANAPITGLVGKYFGGRMPRFFRGPNRPRLGDLAYTETAMFGV